LKPYYLANRAYLQRLRAVTPCAHCGGGPVEWHNPEHVATPTRRLGNMIGSSRANIDAELARCTPLCRRCHMAEDGRLRRLTDENPNPPGKRRPVKPCTQCGSTASQYLRRGLCGRCDDRKRRSRT
jgi:hypothetical protein